MFSFFVHLLIIILGIFLRRFFPPCVALPRPPAKQPPHNKVFVPPFTRLLFFLRRSRARSIVVVLALRNSSPSPS